MKLSLQKNRSLRADRVAAATTSLKKKISSSIIPSIATLTLAFANTNTASAAVTVTVTIQPTAAGTQAVWTVIWSDLTGSISGESDGFNWDSMNPSTGLIAATEPWGFAGEAHWTSVGDPFTTIYGAGAVRGFGDGFGTVTTTPSNYGVGPADNDVVDSDSLFIFKTDSKGGIPTRGSFILSVDVPVAGFTSAYNVGTYTNNLEVTITVTDTPFAAVPEPSSTVVTGLIVGLGLTLRRRK